MTVRPCVEELVAAFECELGVACDDTLNQCEELNAREFGCQLRVETGEPGGCARAASACQISETECLEAFSARTDECALGWRDYVACLENPSLSCAQCVVTDFVTDDCGWPEGAGADR